MCSSSISTKNLGDIREKINLQFSDFSRIMDFLAALSYYLLGTTMNTKQDATSDPPNNVPVPTEAEELSFMEIYSSVMLNNEIIITIPIEEVERVKTGLKNLKAKQATRMKEEGLVPDPSVFTFIEKPCEEEEFQSTHVDLSIQLSRKSVVKVARIKIPDDNF